ncbi:hypothetical protein DDI_3468 [Dickeya dianthicola RNS04.9]|nr:hypothetical protein DDI_3468 [Dickeya dianthicola RNS04.9]
MATGEDYPASGFSLALLFLNLFFIMLLSYTLWKGNDFCRLKRG